MKKMILTLADEKKYTFCCFTCTQLLAIKRLRKDFQAFQDQQTKIQFEVDEKGRLKKDEFGDFIVKELTVEEQGEIDQLDSKIFDFMIDICRKSISKKHNEFEISDDKEEEKSRRQKLMDLLDISDAKRITQFALNGTFIPEESEYDGSIKIEVETKGNNKS